MASHTVVYNVVNHASCHTQFTSQRSLGPSEHAEAVTYFNAGWWMTGHVSIHYCRLKFPTYYNTNNHYKIVINIQL